MSSRVVGYKIVMSLSRLYFSNGQHPLLLLTFFTPFLEWMTFLISFSAACKYHCQAVPLITESWCLIILNFLWAHLSYTDFCTQYKNQKDFFLNSYFISLAFVSAFEASIIVDVVTFDQSVWSQSVENLQQCLARTNRRQMLWFVLAASNGFIALALLQAVWMLSRVLKLPNSTGEIQRIHSDQRYWSVQQLRDLRATINVRNVIGS